MRFHKFRVRNYKSIRDSGDCYLAQRVTILAGKNEAGKSSLLEALYDVNWDRKISDDSVPIERPDTVPEISITLVVDANEVKEMLQAMSLQTTIDDNKEWEITLSKTAPDSYSVHCIALKETLMRECVGAINLARKAVQAELPSDFTEQATSGADGAFVFSEIGDTDLTGSHLEALRSNASKFVQDNEAAIRLDAAHARLVELIARRGALAELETTLLPEIKKRTPNFILFSSFDDVFPNEIPIAELDSNKWIEDLRQISDLDVATIRSGTNRAKITHKTALNVSLDDSYRRFWDQDLSRIKVDWDGTNVQFWIEENGYFYQPAIRSQGKRWHLAFYVRISARSQPNHRNIILIDEPGLYLHATAQRNILEQLEANSDYSPVVFSTHSPYLIEADKLERVRLVIKNEPRGTYVENKVHAVSDKETLTPILTAIGLELNQGIVAADRTRAVIVEGPSDYFYLTALAHMVGWEPFNFISGGGVGNMPTVGTILQGWGCNVLYLYDNDKAFRDAQRNLRREWLTITDDLLAKIPVAGCIENMFSADDFASSVLQGGALSGAPGDHMADKDKVLPAKLFLDRVRAQRAAPLSAETLERFRRLFAVLDEALNRAYVG